MTIWCPPHVDGAKKCVLRGGDYLGGLDNYGLMALYAVNSWADIEFVTPEKGSWYRGNMYCSNKYNEYCSFGTYQEWQCDNVSSDCYVTPSPTESPTSAPSPTPTSSPSPSPTGIWSIECLRIQRNHSNVYWKQMFRRQQRLQPMLLRPLRSVSILYTTSCTISESTY